MEKKTIVVTIFGLLLGACNTSPSSAENLNQKSVEKNALSHFFQGGRWYGHKGLPGEVNTQLDCFNTGNSSSRILPDFSSGNPQPTVTAIVMEVNIRGTGVIQTKILDPTTQQEQDILDLTKNNSSQDLADYFANTAPLRFVTQNRQHSNIPSHVRGTSGKRIVSELNQEAADLTSYTIILKNPNWSFREGRRPNSVDPFDLPDVPVPGFSPFYDAATANINNKAKIATVKFFGHKDDFVAMRTAGNKCKYGLNLLVDAEARINGDLFTTALMIDPIVENDGSPFPP